MCHAELVEAGKLVAISEMFGKINPASGYMIAAICDQKGISYLEFSETYNWMHGSPTMKADAMLAKFVELGGKYVVKSRTPDNACISVTFQKTTMDFSVTWEDVKDEPFTQKNDGNTKSNYATPRKRMQSLWSRATSDAVHTICPQACKGIYTTEEAETFDNDDAAQVRGRDPVLSSPSEAARRGAVAVDVTADVETGANQIDYTVCPIGPKGVVGVPWADLPDETLTFALASDNAAITHAHKGAIQIEVARREEGGAA
jgi:hypothetical protein